MSSALHPVRMLVVPAAVALLCGCATVTSRPDETLGKGDAVATGANEGLTYFLPRQLASVTAKRTDSRLAEAIKKVAKAEDALATATTKVEEKSAALDRARAAVIAAPDNDTARNMLNYEMAIAQAELNAARSVLGAAQVSYRTATGELRTEAAAGSAGGPRSFDVTLAVRLLEPSADPAFLYRLDPKHSVLRDDKQKIEIGKNGLLVSTDIVAADRTSDILVGLATAAGAIFGAPVPVAGARDDDDEYVDCSKAPDTFTGVVDVANRDSLNALNRNLKCLAIRLKPTISDRADFAGPKANSANQIEGIVYRTPVEVLFNVERCALTTEQCNGGSGWQVTEVVAFSLPQAGPISVVPQNAGAMTRSTYKLAFDQGMLTSYSSDRPSEALEVARTPIRLVEGVFDGVSKIISLRTGQTKSLAELSKEELAFANALAAQDRAGISNQTLLSSEQLALANALAKEEVARIDNQRSLSEAERKLLEQQITNQFAGQIAALRQQQGVAGANLSLAQTLLQTDTASATGQLQLLQNQLEQLRTRIRKEALERCVSQQIAAAPAGQAPSVEVCLAP